MVRIGIGIWGAAGVYTAGSTLCTLHVPSDASLLWARRSPGCGRTAVQYGDGCAMCTHTLTHTSRYHA